jgi:predicted RNA-binding Zn-ribbon protein involved in translation (DUF1610 family)
VGEILGALFGSYLFTRLIAWSWRPPAGRAVFAAIAFFVIALVVWPMMKDGSAEGTAAYAAVMYGPCAALWLAFDLWRAGKDQTREREGRERDKREREEAEQEQDRKRATEVARPSRAASSPKAEGTTGNRCNACGAAVGADAEFCDACGKGLAPTCAKCGVQNRSGAQFCKKCGASLPGRESRAPVRDDEPVAATSPTRVPAVVAPAASDDPVSWECPKCGTTNAQRRTQCRKCDAWNPN